MFQGSLNQKIRFLGQKVSSVDRARTDSKVKTEDILSGFQDYFKLSFNLSSRSGPIINKMLNKRVKRYENGTSVYYNYFL